MILRTRYCQYKRKTRTVNSEYKKKIYGLCLNYVLAHLTKVMIVILDIIFSLKDNVNVGFLFQFMNLQWVMLTHFLQIGFVDLLS